MGKESGRHSRTQEEINGILVEWALKGKRVIRLKGGDPFVFGRGGEEIHSLSAHGIPYEVVPRRDVGHCGPFPRRDPGDPPWGRPELPCDHRPYGGGSRRRGQLILPEALTSTPAFRGPSFSHGSL